jgi:hypothetical protein
MTVVVNRASDGINIARGVWITGSDTFVARVRRALGMLPPEHTQHLHEVREVPQETGIGGYALGRICCVCPDMAAAAPEHLALMIAHENTHAGPQTPDADENERIAHRAEWTLAHEKGWTPRIRADEVENPTHHKAWMGSADDQSRQAYELALAAARASR